MLYSKQYQEEMVWL